MTDREHMRVLVCGGRYFDDQSLLNRTLDRFAKTNVVDAIIEGDARAGARWRVNATLGHIGN